MVFPDAQQQQEDDLDLSPDDEEEDEETGLGGEEEEDPYEYDDELPMVPLGGENNSPVPISLNDDLILEGKQHRDKGVHRSSPDYRVNFSYPGLNTFVRARTGYNCTLCMIKIKHLLKFFMFISGSDVSVQLA
jgi:hypothetical protein